MAESSLLWDSGAGGDASPHSEASVTDMFKAIMGASGANKGVVPGMLFELAPSISGTNILMNTGYAIVDGHPYYNSTSLSTPITTPSVGTTGRRLVLRASWSAQTVRATIVTSADGTAAIPAMTQTPGTTYDVPIASFTTTTGGSSTITADDRDWAGNWRNVQIKTKTAAVAHTGTTYASVTATVGNLDIDIKAGEIWEVACTLFYTASSTGGFKIQITVPSGAVIHGFSVKFPARILSDAVEVIVAEIASTLSRATSTTHTASSPNNIPLSGTVEASFVVVNSSNAGKITPQVAQVTAVGTLDVNYATIRGVRA